MQRKTAMNRGPWNRETRKLESWKDGEVPGMISKSCNTIKPSRTQATAAEKRHMGMVAAQGCIICSECLGISDTPAIVHHLRTGQGKKRASHLCTLPLCPFHHQHSGHGVHDMGRAEFAAKYCKSELELLHIIQTLLKVPLWEPTLHLSPAKFVRFAADAQPSCK